MKRALSCVVVAAAAACNSQGVGARAQELETSVTVEQVLDEIQKGIHQARQKLAEDPTLPDLDHVEVSLNTVLKKSGTAGFKILVFSFGRKWEKERVQKVTLRLEPAESSSLAGAPKPPLSEQLTNAIVGASRGAAAAPSHAEVPLTLQKLTVELGFIVRTERAGGVGVKFAIEPISVDLEAKGAVQDEAIQKLTVVFETPPEPTPEKSAPGSPKPRP